MTGCSVAAAGRDFLDEFPLPAAEENEKRRLIIETRPFSSPLAKEDDDVLGILGIMFFLGEEERFDLTRLICPMQETLGEVGSLQTASLLFLRTRAALGTKGTIGPEKYALLEEDDVVLLWWWWRSLPGLNGGTRCPKDIALGSIFKSLFLFFGFEVEVWCLLSID